jgi:hypothetical protein
VENDVAVSIDLIGSVPVSLVWHRFGGVADAVHYIFTGRTKSGLDW